MTRRFMLSLIASAPGAAFCRAQRLPVGRILIEPAHSNRVPAGTTVVLLSKDRIRASEPLPGKVFSAEISEPIENDRDEVLIPRGAEAMLAVVQGSEREGLVLELRWVSFGGERYIVRTAEGPRTDESGSRRGHSLHTARRGAALGTPIKSVPRVSAAGAEVNVPAGILLMFRLEEALMLQGYGQ